MKRKTGAERETRKGKTRDRYREMDRERETVRERPRKRGPGEREEGGKLKEREAQLVTLTVQKEGKRECNHCQNDSLCLRPGSGEKSPFHLLTFSLPNGGQNST
jgi:hypothetical protein